MAFRFEKLNIWTETIEYARQVYEITKNFPKHETFALADQLRKAASSVPANIAEGSGSNSKKDFSHYLDIASKSFYETVSHLYLAKQQNYILEKDRVKLYNNAELLIKKIQAFRKWLNK